jgi:hypothetical protein
MFSVHGGQIYNGTDKEVSISTDSSIDGNFMKVKMQIVSKRMLTLMQYKPTEYLNCKR